MVVKRKAIKGRWSIVNKPHTKTKLQILRKVFRMWLTIWNAPKQQKWVGKEWYIMDLFAGQGYYKNEANEVVSGSPLIFLEEILKKEDKLKKNNIKIKLFFVEVKKEEFNNLNEQIKKFKQRFPHINEFVEITMYRDDCNKITNEIIKQIKSSYRHPLFILIDPWGLQIKKATLEKIAQLDNPKDIILNYILEGVRRTSGILRKNFYGRHLNIREIKTIDTLKEFLGEDIDVIKKTDRKVLEEYVSIFTQKGLNVVGYDMPYPDRKDVLYYLLYISKKSSITEIVKDIYYREKKTKNLQITLFGDEFEKKKIFTATPQIYFIKRNSLLYKTKVEYGDWTINHIIGCKHGCKFPCYAMRMAQKFGWVKDYEDWRKPRIAENALEILEKEIPKYKNEINFVHLCFMSDPFMYDYEKDELIPEVKELTLKIIERLNKERIRVTTLTKGFYPDEILHRNKFLSSNEYGITLVSLNEKFKKQFEPFSAPYEKRIKSLEKLAKAGLKTWVSMEPYPTPDLDETSVDVEMILERIKFVKKIIFGKLNYRRLSDFDSRYCKLWKNNTEFYEEMAKRVISFCKKHNIKYHIKFGTPLSKQTTTNIFNE